MKYKIDSRDKINIDGNEYFIRVRTLSADNPVVLFLHGGCGCPDRAQIMKYQSSLAEKFTLVAFDQRGAGLAYNKKQSKEDLTKDIYIEDIHKVVGYLKSKFNKDKVIIVGHSFGSTLGVWYAEKYPDDVIAYVGVGQCVDYVEGEKISYAWTLATAKDNNDKNSVKALESIGAPLDNGRYKNDHQKSLMKQRAVLHKLGGATYANRKPYWQEILFHDVPIMMCEYSIFGLVKYLKGLKYCPNTTLGNTNPDFIVNAKLLEVPVYLLIGRHDYNCPVALVEKWIDNLIAPDKKIIYFENSAHSPQWEEPALWNAEFAKLFDK